MTDSRCRASILTEHVVVNVLFACALHPDVLRRPADYLAIEVTGRRGVGDRQIASQEM